MSSEMENFRKLCQPLYGFSYKYFDQLKPEDLPNLVYNFILSPLEIYELVKKAQAQIPELFKVVREEDEVMDLWAHKEMVLKCLVVLTNLNFLYEPLKKVNLLEEAVAIRDRLIDDFTEKILEDPAVLASIQEGTIEEEIEKRKRSKAIFNFQPLFEQHRSLVVEPLGVQFQEIPEKF
ncbi:hypothetical protein COW36_22260 [bacterium (Candidatus Blackallbacteria) CG17_big_fil_post_rev_8_21_14_2_50_48_46]|uniref:Uncharacterized protein n=1 Tax=bacterium (Candidatus Blackallbacteria) CG17_big_fil_post_rev_8_21_14_2_50_48_46 TaxID=2014261 RepID=A0A2M7FYS2_9BACT|nr:MAG: hypothetical protein COW64_13690 [bacterium (Candidatus Blackallbacteria) CG18_big_fil_WC_8_21_14_2_50_49_26]PIW14339.1 MAG: hypothetical protein COW36_22260 [bacterium (Candidatus Blackallbacteria) CG17_big_fil_post_rev_8_21_14_2_50_48_46]PIW45608.1 MAG: hypothetical protein COW20_19865 [bacterium (Candidatus Blackallbacteria) CG13_big_fil_rev_8_21_14_2_50_49_14]